MEALVKNAWYPIFRASRLGPRPVSVTRLGQRIVVWRAGGEVLAAAAACPHRGADLGSGRVVDEGRGGRGRRQCLECPYHGIRYASDGKVTLRPAAGEGAPVPDSASLSMLRAKEHKGFVWLWHGSDEPVAGPGWFDVPDSAITVGAEQIWRVHYSRFMEAALDFHHVPFVHRRYVPGVGAVVRDAEVVHEGDRIRMTGALTTDEGRRRFPFEGEVLMPCTLRVVAAGTSFVAAGTPVDDEHTWVAALYSPTLLGRVPLLRGVEAALAMFVDFKLFQRQDRAIFESLPLAPSDPAVLHPMPADHGCMTWIREWQRRLPST